MCFCLFTKWCWWWWWWFCSLNACIRVVGSICFCFFFFIFLLNSVFVCLFVNLFFYFCFCRHLGGNVKKKKQINNAVCVYSAHTHFVFDPYVVTYATTTTTTLHNVRVYINVFPVGASWCTYPYYFIYWNLWWLESKCESLLFAVFCFQIYFWAVFLRKDIVKKKLFFVVVGLVWRSLLWRIGFFVCVITTKTT